MIYCPTITFFRKSKTFSFILNLTLWIFFKKSVLLGFKYKLIHFRRNEFLTHILIMLSERCHSKHNTQLIIPFFKIPYKGHKEMLWNDIYLLSLLWRRMSKFKLYLNMCGLLYASYTSIRYLNFLNKLKQTEASLVVVCLVVFSSRNNDTPLTGTVGWKRIHPSLRLVLSFVFLLPQCG